MKVKINVDLGRSPVPYGDRDDSERIEKMLVHEKFPQYLLGNDFLDPRPEDRHDALNPDRFADKGEIERHGVGIDQWLEGLIVEQLYIISFDAWLDNLDAVYWEIRNAGFFPAGFPALSLLCSFKRANWLCNEKLLAYVSISDHGHLWRANDGRLYLPTLYCNPNPCDRGVGGHWIKYGFESGHPFLVSRPNHGSDLGQSSRPS
jgi:hypothetical protein